MGEGESVETFGEKERDPSLPQPSLLASSASTTTHRSHHDVTLQEKKKKYHHHRDLATPRSTINRPPLHTKRNREWETERKSGSKGERTEGERESLKNERGLKNT